MFKLSLLKSYPYNILFLIVLFAFMIRVWNLNFNSPFLDEALYIVRGLNTLSGNITETYNDTSWVGGNPFFYPTFSGIFYSIGGIIGARFFNVLLGTFCIFLIYQFTKQLLLFREVRYNQIAGLVSAGIMATTTVAITSSRLAIYDALSFTLFLFALVMLHKAIYTGHDKTYFLAALLLFLSFLAKYIIAIFFPILFLLPLYLAWRSKSKEAISGVFQSFCFPLGFLTIGYFILNFSSLQSFFFNNAVGDKFQYAQVISIFWEYSAIIYTLFFLGSIFLWRSRRILIVLLFLLSVIPLITHTLSGNVNSIQQHTFLSLIFLFPVAGTFFTFLIKKNKNLGVIITLLFIGYNLFYSLPQVKQAESFWPNSNKAVQVLRTNVSSTDKLLLEGGDIFTMDLQNITTSDKVTGPFVFSYKGAEGQVAYNQAIEDGYFDFVQLGGTYFSSEAIAEIEEKMSGKYKKIFDDGKIRIYQLIS